MLNYGAWWLQEVWKFEFHKSVFKKNNIGCPQQPPAKKMLKSVKIWIFDHLFHKNGPVLVILVPRIIKAADLVIVLMKWGCWGHWGHWGCWGCRGLWGCRGSKAWKITTDNFRVIKILEFSFILMFWRILFFCYNHEISYWILAPFLSEAVEASRCYFFENQEWISKIYHLRIPKLLSNKILLTHFNLSEPIHKTQFNVRYPVATY